MDLLEIQSPWMPTVRLPNDDDSAMDNDASQEVRQRDVSFKSDGLERPSWRAWQNYLGERAASGTLRKILSTSESLPLLWCVQTAIDPNDQLFIEQLDLLKRKSNDTNNERLLDWNLAANDFLARSANDNIATAPGLQYISLAWAHAMPRLAGRLDEKVWWHVLERLVEQSAEARTGYRGSLLTTQLAGGELGITLAFVFPELPACFEPRNRARQLVVEGILETTDGEGMLHASHFDDMRLLLACWTRCAAMDSVVKKGKLGREARVQLEWLIRQSLRFTRPDGTAVLSQPSATHGNFASLVESALSLAHDSDDRTIADCVLPVPKSRRARALRAVKPDASEHSEWSELAMLQTNWDPDSSSCSVLYPQGNFRIELRYGARLMMSGQLEHELRIDGRTMNTSPTWEETCWMSDQDVDYLELETQLGDGWRIQRQFLLAHDDDFLFWADAILGETSAKIEHRVTFPMAPQVTLHPVDETTELHLNDGSTPIGQALPLGLSEWRSAAHQGIWQSNTGQLHQATTGTALYVPMFFDLSKKRRRKQLTWRHLTVAESLAIVGPDVAAGYRVQIGQEQWIFYRSLATAASRTVLGQNLATDFYAARFGSDGEVEELMDIE
ncbi:MAG: hypothetical protein O2931_12240 [Planctomycetota bacterium]|nr:hypothetical protein [Planctomycetota bacterium]MDA1179556.1 hypothetical protein [Planctomycetota bacterium]